MLDDQFKNPIIRQWCHVDPPPKGYTEIDRLDKLFDYGGCYERIEPCDSTP